MITTQTQKPQRASSEKATRTLLFVLDLSEGRIFSVNPDGSDKKVIVTGCRFPDGIVVDRKQGTFTGRTWESSGRNDGSIERADLDGENRKTIIPRRRHIHTQAAPSR